MVFKLYRFEEEVLLNFILIGRITSALLGTLTIYLVYRTGRLLFHNPAVGLLAAWIVTITPLNVVQTHYLETDVPLAFMGTLCLLAAFYILTQKSKAAFSLGGLLYGLTFSTKPNGLLMALPFLVALVCLIREKQAGEPIKGLIPEVLLFMMATILGILLGAPGLVLNFSQVVPQMVSFVWNLREIKTKIWEGGWLEGPRASRFGYALHFLQEGFGLPWMILAFLGVLYFVYRREKEGLLVLSFPLGYFFIVGLWGRRFGERDLVIMMPFLSLLAAGFLFRVFETGGRNRIRAWIFGILVFGLSINPLWKSLQVDYYYWQDDNRVLAQQWIDRNIPRGSTLALDGYAPKNVDFPLAALDYRDPLEAYQQEFDYLVTSSLDTDRFFSILTGSTHDPKGRRLLALEKKFQLIKEFDLNFRDQAAKEHGRFNFPDFVDPLIRVYATRAKPIRDPLYFPKLLASSRENYTLSFTSPSAYEKDISAFFIPPHRRVKRIIRSGRPLDRVLLVLSNGPQTKTRVTISSGWGSNRAELNPREVKTLLITPHRSFPYIRDLYGIEIQTKGESNVWGQLVTDPFRIGVLLLHDQKAREALPFLAKAAQENPARLEGLAFLAAAYAARGDFPSARKFFQEIEGRDPSYWSRYLQWSHNDLPYPEWLRYFTEVSGYYLPLLRQATQYRHIVPPTIRFFSQEGKQEIKEGNFVAASEPEPDGTPAIKLWSQEMLPQGSFQARFRIKFFALPRGDLPVIRVDVLKHSHEGLVGVGVRRILGKDLTSRPGTVEEFTVPFDNPVLGGEFEFRVFSLNNRTDFTLQEVEVSLDLRRTMRNNLELFLSAGEKVFKNGPRDGGRSKGLLQRNPAGRPGLLQRSTE
jgi:tetratricopeptide (TPR) repeat protein